MSARTGIPGSSKAFADGPAAPAGIAYVDGARLRRSILAACRHARRHRGDLDRINVFPVPDGDTGTNLALTLKSIADGLEPTRERSVSAVARIAARGAVLGARGNSGMLLSHFFQGLAEGAGDRRRMEPGAFVEALQAGAEAVRDALEDPVEGTILTVIRDTADEAARVPDRDFVPLLERMLAAARASLARTPELLPVLSRAGVVDAGAQGFVHLLEGVLALVRGEGELEGRGDRRESAAAARRTVEPSAAALAEFPETAERFRFCTEALVRGASLPDRDAFLERLRPMGDSLIVLRTGDLLKVHIHTDHPDRIFEALGGYGRIEARKVEDMREQHDRASVAAGSHVSLARRQAVVVTDSACDLPDELLRAHGILVTPLELVDGERTLRDGVDITAEAFHRRLHESGPLPTTSQPAPAAFMEAFQRAASEGDAVVGVLLGSTLSGTFGSAQAAAARFEAAPVHLADSRGASLLQGLLVLRAAELAEAGLEPREIVREVARIRSRSGILFTVRTLDRLRASGRVSLGRALLARALGLKPVLEVDPEGRVRAAGKARGEGKARSELLRMVGERVPTGARGVRFGVVHVGAPELAADVTRSLREIYGGVDILTAPATPVLATHLGIGAWGVAWTVDEGIGPRAGIAEPGLAP